MSKKRYFVSYAAYSKDGKDMVLFNNIVTFTDGEKIDSSTIEKMQDDLLEILENDEVSKGMFISTQIIGLTPLEPLKAKEETDDSIYEVILEIARECDKVTKDIKLKEKQGKTAITDGEINRLEAYKNNLLEEIPKLRYVDNLLKNRYWNFGNKERKN